MHRALVLGHQLFLVVQRLLLNRIARPRRLVARQVHLRLRQYPLVPLQNPLRLGQRCRVRSRVDLDQRRALLHQLSLRVVNRRHNPVHLAADRRGIHRSHRPDGVHIHADVSLQRRHRCDYDRTRALPPRRRRRRRGILVLAQHQKESRRKKQQQENPHRSADSLLPRSSHGYSIR